MDRFFYYLLGGMLAVCATAVGIVHFTRSQATEEEVDPPAAVGKATANASPGAVDPKASFAYGRETPTPAPLEMPTPEPAPTPLPWSPPNTGKVVTVGYPGFTVVYSETLGNPLAVQYAMVNNAKPKRYPPPAAVKTSAARLVAALGYSRGGMALPKSIALYFGKQAGESTGLMTNVCAFQPACLAGPWSAFSDLEARWAGEWGWLEIVAGPLFESPPTRTANGLVIPAAFFRAYRRSDGECLAFIVPQTATSAELKSYLTSVSAVEAASGLSIFTNTLSFDQRERVGAEIW